MGAAYYDGAHRVIRDGAPMRVYIKRSREQSARIAAIEIARDAGVPVDLDDAPTFAFAPSQGKGPYRSKGARPVPSPSDPRFYKGAKRYVIGGVPCRLYRDKLNHTFSHWSDGEPMGGFEKWAERAKEWWNGLEEARPIPDGALGGSLGDMLLAA